MDDLTEKCSPEVYLKELRRLDADRVLLCPTPTDPATEAGRAVIAQLARHAAFFKANGLEVGCWIWTFSCGQGKPYTYMTSPTGRVHSSEACPTDKDWQRFMGDFIAAVAGCGVDLIQFDDDYRFGFQEMGVGCACENHRKLMAEELGYEPDFSELTEKCFSGGPNPVRTAWIRANGRSLEDFAAEMRRRVDEVNPDVRLGYCTCMTNWDIDGTHPDRIARLMAGKTKPFYRLIGAPYWAPLRAWGSRIADVIELERMEKTWNDDPEIEIFSECDAYPRPRTRCPAAYLEGFDTALRADGRLDGILKYGLDYTSDPGFETGYQLRHELHRALYKGISALFDGKDAVGMRVYESPAKVARMTIPAPLAGGDNIDQLYFSYAARLLTNCAVPIRWEGTDAPGIVFGGNALDLPDEALRHGLILDAAAAEYLSARGVDVGVRSFGERIGAGFEVYPGFPGRVYMGSVTVRRLEVDPAAVIESRFEVGGGSVPGTFRYENAAGQRFFVLCFDGQMAEESLFRSYARQRQIADACRWFGSPLPAHLVGEPDLYMMVKQSPDGRSMAVGLWNFGPDDIPMPVVQMSDHWTDVTPLNCEAQIENNTVKLTRIEPFGFAAFEVRK